MGEIMGWRLYELMDELGISNQDLANQMGLARQITSRWRVKKGQPLCVRPKISCDRMQKICDALSSLSGRPVEIADLVGQESSEILVSQSEAGMKVKIKGQWYDCRLVKE